MNKVTKILLLFVAVTIVLSSGCSYLQSSTEDNSPETSSPTAKESLILKEYFLVKGPLSPFESTKMMELNVVERWLYSSSKQLNFKSLNPPYVVNAAIRQRTSQVVMEFQVRVYSKDDPYKQSDYPISSGGRQAFIIKQKGDYIIEVTSVGCEWWVQVGHETEAYRAEHFK